MSSPKTTEASDPQVPDPAPEAVPAAPPKKTLNPFTALNGVITKYLTDAPRMRWDDIGTTLAAPVNGRASCFLNSSLLCLGINAEPGFFRELVDGDIRVLMNQMYSPENSETNQIIAMVRNYYCLLLGNGEASARFSPWDLRQRMASVPMIAHMANQQSSTNEFISAVLAFVGASMKFLQHRTRYIARGPAAQDLVDACYDLRMEGGITGLSMASKMSWVLKEGVENSDVVARLTSMEGAEGISVTRVVEPQYVIQINSGHADATGQIQLSDIIGGTTCPQVRPIEHGFGFMVSKTRSDGVRISDQLSSMVLIDYRVVDANPAPLRLFDEPMYLNLLRKCCVTVFQLPKDAGFEAPTYTVRDIERIKENMTLQTWSRCLPRSLLNAMGVSSSSNQIAQGTWRTEYGKVADANPVQRDAFVKRVTSEPALMTTVTRIIEGNIIMGEFVEQMRDMAAAIGLSLDRVDRFLAGDQSEAKIPADQVVMHYETESVEALSPTVLVAVQRDSPARLVFDVEELDDGKLQLSVTAVNGKKYLIKAACIGVRGGDVSQNIAYAGYGHFYSIGFQDGAIYRYDDMSPARATEMKTAAHKKRSIDTVRTQSEFLVLEEVDAPEYPSPYSIEMLERFPSNLLYTVKTSNLTFLRNAITVLRGRLGLTDDERDALVTDRYNADLKGSLADVAILQKAIDAMEERINHVNTREPLDANVTYPENDLLAEGLQPYMAKLWESVGGEKSYTRPIRRPATTTSAVGHHDYALRSRRLRSQFLKPDFFKHLVSKYMEKMSPVQKDMLTVICHNDLVEIKDGDTIDESCHIVNGKWRTQQPWEVLSKMAAEYQSVQLTEINWEQFAQYVESQAFWECPQGHTTSISKKTCETCG